MHSLYPKISVIIPHFNMAGRLPRAVESVYHQDYKNIDLIVVDDGSEERVTMTKEFAPRTRGISIRYLEIEHSGKPAAVNRGFKAAKGEYLTILDADDLLPPHSLSVRMRAMALNEADLCIGSFCIQYGPRTGGCRKISKMGEKGSIRLSEAQLTRILSPFHQNAMMFSRSLLERTGEMDIQMIRGQDKDFAFRLLRASSKTVFSDQPVYIYRKYKRPFSVRISNRLAGIRFGLVVINRYFGGLKRIFYLFRFTMSGSAKMVFELFFIYKK